MSSALGAWAARIREVGEAFLALVRAELAALGDDLRSSGRSLARALLLAAISVAILFWGVGLLVDLLVELAALALPRWGAMLGVLALLVVGAWAVAAAARRRFRDLESPAATLRRRLEESRSWWRSRIETEIGSGEEDS